MPGRSTTICLIYFSNFVNCYAGHMLIRKLAIVIWRGFPYNFCTTVYGSNKKCMERINGKGGSCDMDQQMSHLSYIMIYENFLWKVITRYIIFKVLITHIVVTNAKKNKKSLFKKQFLSISPRIGHVKIRNYKDNEKAFSKL